MARREARRFFGIGRRTAGEAVFIIAMIVVSAIYFATERGLIILVGILAVAALIFFILERVFGVYLWRRPRHEFYSRKRAGEAPRRIGWRYPKKLTNPCEKWSKTSKTLTQRFCSLTRIFKVDEAPISGPIGKASSLSATDPTLTAAEAHNEGQACAQKPRPMMGFRRLERWRRSRPPCRNQIRLQPPASFEKTPDTPKSQL
jgi:hypothetical protein